jgi:diamine N-acetyltransferase
MISLKKSKLKDRNNAYNWLYHSDYSPALNEMQGYAPDNPPDLTKFENDYEDFYFEDSKPEKGRAYLIVLKEDDDEENIGFISYTAIHLKKGMAEIDIWLKGLKYTGKGYGTNAVNILSDKLFHAGFHTLIIRPCLKNKRAIRSYLKSGFHEESLKPENYYKNEYMELALGDCGPGNDLFLVKKAKN